MSNGGKKPQSKKVAHLLESLRRRSGIRNLQKRFLVVCEDGKSAPNYFEALKKHENLSATSIEVFGSGGYTQPIQVVRSAVHRMKRAAENDSGTEPFDEVWCVIDGDYGSEIHNARDCARANCVKLAISNKCFEYWILLHFQEYDTPDADCDCVVNKLKKLCLPMYSKGGCDFSHIVPLARTASDRAKKLRQVNTLAEDQNPCSDVYLLIDQILSAIL